MNEEEGKESISKCETIDDAKSLLIACTNENVFVSLHTKEGSYQAVSASFQNITGYSLQDVVGESAYSYFHPEDVKVVLKSHAAVTLKPDLSSLSIRFRKPNGSYAQLQSYSKQLQGEANEGMIIVFSQVVE